MKIYITPILANGISSASLKRKQPNKWAIEILGGPGRNRTRAEDVNPTYRLPLENQCVALIGFKKPLYSQFGLVGEAGSMTLS